MHSCPTEGQAYSRLKLPSRHLGKCHCPRERLSSPSWRATWSVWPVPRDQATLRWGQHATGTDTAGLSPPMENCPHVMDSQTGNRVRTGPSRPGPPGQVGLMRPREPTTHSLVTPWSAQLRIDIRLTVRACPWLTSVRVPGRVLVPFSAVWARISSRARLIPG